MSDYETVFTAASQLPISERLRLIDELSADVPDDSPPTLSAEWLAEIARRSDELDNTAASTESWTEVRARLMRKAGGEGAD